MKVAREFVTSTVVGGVFVVVPVYLAILLLLKGMQSVAGLVRPVAALLPDWLPAERVFARSVAAGLLSRRGGRAHAGRA